ncbi:hypothetical protein EAG_13660 [Camponotus floridanus]|uniref:CHK kinase-like domain-containing protein n=1 Tax=Camponotus floridanus TaxID=104421 RepID=E2A3Y3_CAMFO|nr:hypothetical protein EAG_13660 [Camponotus floridanus]
MVLRKELCDETINVLHVKTSNFEKGINFLSDFFKVRITYTILSKIDKKIAIQIADIVVKSEPIDGIQLTMVHEQGMFIRELKMLKEVLPKIEKLVHKQLGPKLWYGSSEFRILVMENLSERGFVMKDRQKGLSMEQCLLVIEQLAKLHAGSVALHEKEPKLIESFKSGGILSVNCPASFMRMSEVSLLNVSKAIRDWTDQKYAHIATKLDKLAKTFRIRCADIYEYEPNEFCVLNHGIILGLRMMADSKETEDFADVLEKLQGETKMDVFKNADTVMLVQKMIPIMDQRGYFD